MHAFTQSALDGCDLLSYVDDGTIMVQSKDIDTNLTRLKDAYWVMEKLLTNSGLVLKHDKSEVFHFSRAHKYVPKNLVLSDTITLTPKIHWRYLGFFFDRKLLFREHTRFYSARAFSSVKAMRMLGNSARGLTPLQKRLLYRSCVLPVATYGFRLWFYRGARNKKTLKNLNSMQRRAALWITGAFRTSPNVGVEAIAGVIPIHLHLRKLSQRSCTRMNSLHTNHGLHSISGLHPHIAQKPHSIALLSTAQKKKVGGPLLEAADICRKASEILSALPDEDRPGYRILDQFSSQIRFEDFDRTKKGASGK